MCCTKNRCSESSRSVTSPLSPKSDQHHFSLTNAAFLYYSQKTDYWSKWSTTEVDSLDHIQNRILWIHDLKRFFYTTEPKEWILPAVTWNTFKRYISYLTTLLIFKPIFEHEAWIKRSILSVLLGRKISHYKQDLHCSNSQGQDCYTTLLASRSYLISRLVVIWLAYNHPEYNERSANLQHCRQPCYSYLWATVDIVGCFYGNEWKIIPFWIHHFFSQWKILMIQIFDLISSGRL